MSRRLLMKRLLVCGLCLVIVLSGGLDIRGSVWCGSNKNALAAEYNDFEYEINDEGTITITGCDISKEEITIPEQINGVKVTKISSNAFVSDSLGIGDFYTYFKKESKIRKINIPSSIIDIQGYPFMDCYCLEYISVDSKNEYYSSEKGILYDKFKTTILRLPCKSGIQSYVVPSTVNKIAPGSFAYCENLKTIENLFVQVIPDFAFCRCENLENIVLTNMLETIGVAAFGKCTSLKNVTLPNTLRYIDSTAFAYCQNLTSISISENVYYISDYAFEGCENLKVINVDKYNENYASKDGVLFNKDKTILIQYPGGRKSLNYIVPNSVEIINTYAFNEAVGLEGITLPEKFTVDYDIEVGWQFYGCNNLKNIYVDENNSKYTSMDGVLFNKDKTELIFYPNNHAEKYTIPYGVERCLGISSNILKKLTLTEKVSGISLDDLSDCTNLEEIIVDENNSYHTDIDGVLFSKDKKTLWKVPCAHKSTNYNIPEETLTISGMAFKNCTTLQNITIPRDAVIDTEYNGYFEGCINLKNIYVDEQNDKYKDIDGVFFSKDGSILYRYPAGKENEKYIIPDATKELENGAFDGCKYVKSVKVSDEVTKVQGSVFWACDNLETVWLPKTVSKIGNNAFGLSNNLKNIIILNPECEVTDWTFYNIFSENTIVYGYKDSAVQECAENTGLGFVPIQCDIGIHVWGDEYIVDLKPTCTKVGYKSNHCIICDSMDYSNVEEIESLGGHVFVDGVCTVCGQNIYFYDVIPSEYSDSGEDEVVIYGYGGDETNVIIPEEIDGYKVTSVYLVGMNPEWNYTKLESLTVPRSVTYIDPKEEWKLMGENIINIKKIYGYFDSYAETYANENDLIFIPLDVKADTDAELRVERKDYEDVKANLENYIGNYIVENAMVYDMYLIKDNERVQPDGDITVSILVPDGMNGTKCKVFYINDSGKLTDMNALYEDGYMVFTTNHFSYYVLVEVSLNSIIGDVNGDGKINGLDRVMLTRYLAKWTDYPTESIDMIAADVNCDGLVNGLDRLILTRYLANWTEYTELPYIN